MVDTGDMCQVEDTDEWRSGNSSTKEQELAIVRQEGADEEEAERINDGNAARPTSSVPAKAKAAVKKTAQTP